MLKFLSKIRYRRLIFALIWTPLTVWLWVTAYTFDVENAKGGVVELQSETYFFGPFLLIFVTVLFIMILEIILGLAFDTDINGIQQYFQHKSWERENEEQIARSIARDRAFQERLQEEKEEMELKQFISDCLAKGKIQ